MDFLIAYCLTNADISFDAVFRLLSPLLFAIEQVVARAVELPILRAQEFSGGVGSAVAAYLQTKGLIDQAKILVDFKDALEWIAALAYLFSIAMAVGALAVFGNYRQGLYFLVGPPLFFYMITTTISTDGTVLRVGDRVVGGHQQEQKKLLQTIRAIGEDGESVKVSFFFGIFDNIVTEVTQKIVSVFLDTEGRDDLRFVARERALNYVVGASPESSGLVRLVGAIHFGECAPVFSAFQRSYAAGRKVPQPLRPNDDIEDAVSRALGIGWTSRNRPIDAETATFLIAMKKAGVPEFQNVTFTDSAQVDVNKASCQEVWGWVAGGCKRLAKKKLTIESFKGSFQSGNDEIPWAKVQADVMEYLGTTLDGNETGGNGNSAEDTLAAFIYKNTLQRSSVSALSSQVFSRTPADSKEYQAVFGALQHAEAHGGYMKLKYFAYSIPYMQGFLLYLLSIAFPFFAVFLVLPGRAASFLVWCSLWVWVKSWDIGFAMVHVARDILWHMLQDRTNFFQEKISWADPRSVNSIIYNNDPFFNQNTYWEMVSLLTVSVPFITAHLCLGATSFFDMFRASIDQTAGRFRNAEVARSKRHVANVSEATQRMDDFKVHQAFMEAAAHDTNNSKDPNSTERASTITGEGLTSTGGDRAHHMAAAFNVAQYLSHMGSRDHMNSMMGDLAAAHAENKGHLLRGMPSMHMPLQRNQLESIYGKGAKTDAMVANNATWADVFEDRSALNRENQATTNAATGRRMFHATRGVAKVEKAIQMEETLALLRRDPSAAATKAQHLLGLGEVMRYFEGDKSPGAGKRSLDK